MHTGLLQRIVMIVGLAGACIGVGGCSDAMMKGVAIGLGTSAAAGDAQAMAQESKTALVAKILQLRQDLENAATPAEYAALEAKLAEAEKKQEYADLTANIADSVKEGIERDWGDEPASGDNLAWILGAAATVFGGVAGKQTMAARRKDAAIARVKIAAKPDAEKEIYTALNEGA